MRQLGHLVNVVRSPRDCYTVQPNCTADEMTFASFRQGLGGAVAAALLLVALVAPAIAQGLPSSAPPDESNLDRHGYYTNSFGHEVHQPAGSLNGKVPGGASARCRDGDYSFSEHHSGTCSGHGGVAQWLR